MNSPSNFAKLKKSLIFQAVLLGGFALAAAALLSAGNLSTKDAILERQAEDLKASLSQVVPKNLYDNKILADKIVLTDRLGQSVDIYRARRRGRIVAFAYQAKGQGYGGEISLIMGVAEDGDILGVRVLAHAETPGLGDKIEINKDDWILDFDDKSLKSPAPEKWQVKKDGGPFDQFAGATITPRGVVKAVKEGLEFFAKNKHKMRVEIDKTKEPEK